MRVRGYALLSVLVLTCLVRVAAGAELGYTITDLGTLGGTGSEAYAVNSLGQVAGRAQNGDGTWRAFLWLPESAYGLPTGINDFGTLGGDGAEGLCLNAAGQVVGQAQNDDPYWRPFIWLPESAYGLPAGMSDLGTLGGAEGFAEGINDSGQVAGTAQTGTGPWHAFLWQNGTIGDLGTLDGGESYGRDINSAGQVAGRAQDGEETWRAFLWTDANGNGEGDAGEMQDLGTLNGPSSRAYGLNDLGQVVGGADTGEVMHAFLWLAESAYGLPAGMTDIDTLGSDFSKGYEINEAGHVVGFARIDDQHRAFVWRDGVMHDLNDLIPSGSDWLLTSANGINDSGQIVGWGIAPGGGTRAFLLTPIPEPGALALAALGALGLLSRRRAK